MPAPRVIREQDGKTSKYENQYSSNPNLTFPDKYNNRDSYEGTFKHRQRYLSNLNLNWKSHEEHNNRDRTGRSEGREIRIVLVGRTGSGKSATGNFLMGERYFESKMNGNSVTQECKRGVYKQFGQNLVIVDTPGLFDTKLPPEKLSTELIRCIHMSIPGPHVFLLVVQISRFTNEEIETFNQLFDLFGEQMGNFAVLAFTRLDDLDRDNITIEEYIQSSPQILTELLKRCNNRFVGVDNYESNETKRNAKVTELLKMFDTLIKENGGQYYTNKMYKEAEENLRQKIMEVERQKAEEKEMEIAKIRSHFSKETEYLYQQNKALEKKVADIEKTREAFKNDRDITRAEIYQLKQELQETNAISKRQLYEEKKHAMTEKENHIAELKELERKHENVLQELEVHRQNAYRKRDQIEYVQNEEINRYIENQELLYRKKLNEITEGNQNALKNMQHLYKQNKQNERMLAAAQNQLKEQSSRLDQKDAEIQKLIKKGRCTIA